MVICEGTERADSVDMMTLSQKIPLIASEQAKNFTLCIWIIITMAQLDRKLSNLAPLAEVDECMLCCDCAVLQLCGASHCILCISGSVCHPPSAAGPTHSFPRVRRWSVWRTIELNSHPLHWKSQVKTILHTQQSTLLCLLRTGGFNSGLSATRA